MNKRILTTILSLILITTGVSAQNESKQPSAAKLQAKARAAMKKDIAQAKAFLKAGNNLDKAEQLMRKHLSDTANVRNERLWLIMFDAVKKQYDQGNEKLYLKQKYDTASLFNLTKKMFDILEAFDTIDARPNERGEVKPQYRKRHGEFLDSYRNNLYNGGVYFIGKQKFSEAYSFFDTYLESACHPLFKSYNYSNNDKRMPEAAYWAVYCGYKMQQPKATLHHTYYALKDTAHYQLMLQYLADTYQLEGDTSRYIGTLREGFEKYPEMKFFFSRLVDFYGTHNQWENVLQVASQAIDKDSDDVEAKVVRSTALLNTSRYDDCIAFSNQLIALSDSLADPYYNSGMASYYRAIEIDRILKPTSKQRQAMQNYYQQAMKHLERYRQLAPDQQDRWALPLYTIYLNLNMGKEFDEINQLIRQKANKKN